MSRKGILIVVSGFAGTGKGTLVNRLIGDYDNYALSISMTTRKPRGSEQNGVEYFFVTKEEFEDKIGQDGLIEYACYVGNYYGTPRAYVEKQLSEGKDVILEIEIQGALKVKERYPDSLLVFVMPPSAEELKRRLVGRGTETMDVIEKRMRRAVEESEGIEKYDYILVNDEIDACVKRLHGIVQATHEKPEYNLEFIKEIREELSQMWKGEN